MARNLTISEMKQINKAKGKHYFDKDTMSFFNSRIESPLYNDKRFVTSEQFVDKTRDFKAPRKFTVREFDKTTGNVHTVGEFQQYLTKDSAIGVARGTRRSKKLRM